MELLRAAIMSAGTAWLATLIGKPNTNTSSCMNANDFTKQPLTNVILQLPIEKGICPSPSTNPNNTYEFFYFSPISNPLGDSTVQYTGVSQAQVTLNNVNQSYICFDPNKATTNQNTIISNATVYTYTVNGQTNPVNMMPQILTNNAAPFGANTGVIFQPNGARLGATASYFPTGSAVTSNNQIALVVPGVPYANTVNNTSNPNPINTPSFGGSTYNGNSVSAFSKAGQSNIMYLKFLQPVDIYLELGGAKGGNVVLYTTGVDSNGNSEVIQPGFTGGLGGTVYGLLKMAANDTLKIFLGTQGIEVTDPTNIPSFQGQAGLSTILGGANGGGPSYAFLYTAAKYKDSLTEAYADANGSKGTLVAVAGGGGGAGRNASGGDAGQADAGLHFGVSTSVTLNGSAGGKSFYLGQAPKVISPQTNDLSGGGGILSTPGQSGVPHQFPSATSSYGTSLKPFDDGSRHGGGSVLTDTGSGGGGGGGGLFGGGSGSWNGSSKPNNIHGSGGGGASWINTSLLRPTVNGTSNVCLNLYNTVTDAPWRSSFDGYLVLGIQTTLN